MINEPEIVTRKKRIDIRLKRLGWVVMPYELGLNTSLLSAHALEEYPTSSGPADYAFFVNGRLLGIAEAKKVTIATINALEQAKRYAKGVVHSIGKWGDYMVPFLYSSNGEQVGFLDVRNSKNISRTLANFHTPAATVELFERNYDECFKKLKDAPNDDTFLRYYQKEAIESIEKSIEGSKRRMLVAMATGTGKTFTAVSGIYRLLKSGTAKRVLFLVDRKALAAQTAITFAAFQTPAGNKFNQEYEVYSQRFKKEEIEGEKFDVGVLPNQYLTNPDGTKTFVYVCTIQRMAINLLGKDAAFYAETNDSDDDSDTDKMDIPIHAFDVIIADECHRGYTSKETNVWRSVLEYFDAIKIGLTATPAAHTVAFFGSPVYRYTVGEAVEDGYLVDYDAVKINSNIRMNGVFLREGEQVGKIDTETGQLKIEGLEDERAFDASKVEREITSPDSNRKIIEEIIKHALTFEKENERFPKTLIFAVNDIQHTSHSDQIVQICKDVLGRGDDYVVKITGNPNVDRPLQKIRQFRNRPEPRVVVTVDMLSTGVDIPELEYIVFMRPVKSRILWEQMLGRGTRLCDSIHKDRFTVFDCFNGTLIEYFKDASNFKFEDIGIDPVPIKEIIRRINDNEDREYNVKAFIRRIRRIEKNISSEGRQQFTPFIKDGDIGAFADHFLEMMMKEFSATMKILNNPAFQDLLVNYKRAKHTFVVAYETKDEVTSEFAFEAGSGHYLKPEEYLKAFSDFVIANKEKMQAMRIVIEKPKEWKTSVLKELRAVLMQNNFSEKDLRKAHKYVYQKDLVDIISMFKHAAREEEPVMNVSERIEKAINKVIAGKSFTKEQLEWLGFIKEHLMQNLTIGEDDIKEAPIFERHGGLAKFKKVFNFQHNGLINEINTAIAA